MQLCCCAFSAIMSFPAFILFGFYLSLPCAFYVAFPWFYCMSLFLHFPPTFLLDCSFFMLCQLLVGAVRSMIAVSATGFCFQLCPFPAPEMLLNLLLFRFLFAPLLIKIYFVYQAYILKIKVHASCEIEDFCGNSYLQAV